MAAQLFWQLFHMSPQISGFGNVEVRIFGRKNCNCACYSENSRMVKIAQLAPTLASYQSVPTATILLPVPCRGKKLQVRLTASPGLYNHGLFPFDAPFRVSLAPLAKHHWSQFFRIELIPVFADQIPRQKSNSFLCPETLAERPNTRKHLILPTYYLGRSNTGFCRTSRIQIDEVSHYPSGDLAAHEHDSMVFYLRYESPTIKSQQ